MDALRKRPLPLTDDYIRHLIEVYDDDPNRTQMDHYWIETVVAMDAVGAKTLWEWDYCSDTKTGYKEAQARITRILFQDGKLSQELAIRAGAFD
jgi:hypothetical protein